MRYLSKKINLVMMDPGWAVRLLAQPYDRQRALSGEWVAYLCECMKRDEYKPDVVQLHHYIADPRRPDDEVVYVTDGQHQLSAIIQMDRPQEVGLFDFFTDDAATIDEAYAFTQAGRNRSIRDRMVAYRGKRSGPLTIKQERSLATAVLVLRDGFRSSSSFNALNRYEQSPQQRSRGMDYWWNDAAAYFAAIGDGGPIASRLLTAAVVAVALVTFRYQPDRAQEFWRQVSERDQLVKNSPQWKLVDLLLTTKQREGGQHEMSRRVANCWNAFFEGKTLVRNQVRNPASPIDIAGTPHRGHLHLAYIYGAEPDGPDAAGTSAATPPPPPNPLGWAVRELPTAGEANGASGLVRAPKPKPRAKKPTEEPTDA